MLIQGKPFSYLFTSRHAGLVEVTRAFSTMSDKLFNCRVERPDALCRLICFPWAGGGTNYYVGWSKKLPETIEVVAVRPPGRESRMREPCHKHHEDLINEVVTGIMKKYSNKPFAIFGHSFGAAMGFEAARVLKEKYNMQPVYLFASANSAPHSRLRLDTIEKRAKLSEQEFTDWIMKNGGTPPGLGEAFMKLFLPVIRDDLKLLDGYIYQLPDTPPLTCPISAFDGDKDRHRDIEGFRDLTSSSTFHIERLPGHHFYLQEETNENYLLDHMINKLEDMVPGVTGTGLSQM